MPTFGWCDTGHHKACSVKFQRMYHGTKRQGRKTVEAIVYLDEWYECSCWCHTEGGKPPAKKKAAKKAAKKTSKKTTKEKQ